MVAVVCRIFFGTRIVYDVQENYWRNILWTDTYPLFIRQLLAIWVRVKEVVLARFFHLFILAEKGFEKELKFFRNKFIVLENKSSLPADLPRTKSSDAIRLLFSGTISESTGVFQAIDIAHSLYQHDQSVSLHIIGHCAVPSTLERIRQLIKDKPYILLTGGAHLVPHEDIIYQISTSDFGIIYYPHSPHIENKIPTKLYEYLSARLPILIQDYQPWLERCAPYQAAIPISFNSTIDAALLLNKMRRSSFYTKSPKDVFWSSEEKKLLESIKKVLA
jgi:glycosyltransferase involved in cell wall biosynthesis